MSSNSWKKKYEFLEYLISMMPGNIYWKNRKGIYLGCNNNLAEIHGFKTNEEIIGLDEYDMLQPADADVVSQIDNAVMVSEKEKELEEHGFSKSGKSAIYLTRKVPIRDKQGNIMGMAGISVDITDRKKMEEKLKEALGKSELANQAKTEFLENMSHDLRTALSGIQGFSELLRDDVIDLGQGDNQETREHIDNLVASCRALTHIHRQILHAIHVFSGDIPACKNKFNLEGKLKNIINLHLAKANEKGLKLSLRYDKKIPKYFVGDCRRFSAIALELISNALKYTDEGAVTVNAALEKKQGKEYVIKLSVKDTGIGIAKDKKDEIFTRFGRITPAYEGKYIGLGLGLSVVKKFVDDLGGEIYVDSKPNQGSTFTCYLPFIKSLSSDNNNVEEGLILPVSDMEIGEISIRPILKKAAAIAAKSKSESHAQTNNAVPAILQVEDEEICALITQAVLKNFGFKVDLASNGSDALKKIKNNHYDLVLMDVGLPDISGIEVTRKMRIEEKNTNTHTPIIALTAHVDVESKQQCIESGMDAVLSKPIASERLFEILKAFIPESIEKLQPKTKESKYVKSAQPNKDENVAVLPYLEGPILDFEYMKKTFWYDPKETKKMLQETAAPSLSCEMKLLKEANAKKDWSSVQKIAHKMSGACSSCGLMRLQAVCRRLEIYLMGKNSKATKSLVDLLIEEYKDVQVAIKGL